MLVGCGRCCMHWMLPGWPLFASPPLLEALKPTGPGPTSSAFCTTRQPYTCKGARGEDRIARADEQFSWQDEQLQRMLCMLVCCAALRSAVLISSCERCSALLHQQPHWDKNEQARQRGGGNTRGKHHGLCELTCSDSGSALPRMASATAPCTSGPPRSKKRCTTAQQKTCTQRGSESWLREQEDAGRPQHLRQPQQAQQGRPTTAGAARTVVAKHIHHQRQQLVLHLGKQLCGASVWAGDCRSRQHDSAKASWTQNMAAQC